MGGAAALNLAAGVVGSAVGLVIAALVSRHLGVDGAGTYFLVVAAFLIAANTVELGADTGLVRFVAAARAVGRTEEIPVLVRSAVRPVLVAVGLLVAATAAIALLVDPVDGVSPWLLTVASVVAGALAMTAVLLGVSRGFGDSVTYPMVQNLLLPLGRLGAVAVAVLAGWGVSGVLGAWLAPVPLALVVAAAVALRIAHRGATGRPSVLPSARRELGTRFWGFSAARGVTACVEILLEWIDVILVGALASPAEAGVYAVVTRCVRAGEVVQQAGRIVAGPRISGVLARGDTEAAGRIYGLVTAAMIWVAWPFFILLAVFADQVLRVFGPGFVVGAAPMAVLAVAMALATAAGTVQTVLLMGGRSRWQLADKSGALVLNVSLDVLLIPAWGITGAAIAWAVTIVVDTAVVIWQVQGLMAVRPSRRPVRHAIAQPLVVVALPALAARFVFGSSSTTAIATTTILAVVYLGVGWVTRDALGLTKLFTRPERCTPDEAGTTR
jgi:O-antigen/teichoic acid export membrane protein